MNNSKNEAPLWLVIVGVIALLWNLMGVWAFYGDMTKSAADLAVMEPALKNWYETTPIWVNIAYGGAVILGALGSLGLILKKRWCTILLGLSLVCVLAQMGYNFAKGGYDIAGDSAKMLGFMVLAVAALLALLSRWSNNKGYLA